MPIAPSKAEILQSVERRMQLASAATHKKIKRGLASLASIVATAPLIGLLGTIIGILDSPAVASGRSGPVLRQS